MHKSTIIGTRIATQTNCLVSLYSLTTVHNQESNMKPFFPDNSCRTHLRPTGEPGSEYINASFVDVS